MLIGAPPILFYFLKIALQVTKTECYLQTFFFCQIHEPYIFDIIIGGTHGACNILLGEFFTSCIDF